MCFFQTVYTVFGEARRQLFLSFVFLPISLFFMYGHFAYVYLFSVFLSCTYSWKHQFLCSHLREQDSGGRINHIGTCAYIACYVYGAPRFFFTMFRCFRKFSSNRVLCPYCHSLISCPLASSFSSASLILLLISCSRDINLSRAVMTFIREIWQVFAISTTTSRKGIWFSFA